MNTDIRQFFTHQNFCNPDSSKISTVKILRHTWTPFNHHYSHRLYRAQNALYTKKYRLSMLPVSIGLPGSRSQGSYAPSLGALNIFIFMSYRVLSPHQLDTANAHTILTSHMMAK